VGLSKEQAVTVTTPTAQAMSSTPVSFISAASGRFGDFVPAGTTVHDPGLASRDAGPWEDEPISSEEEAGA
jgi:hypothetical protein